jgi:S-adenosylmethionine:diacylglycerol 3-amino-3-carboxypropyl transferase
MAVKVELERDERRGRARAPRENAPIACAHKQNFWRGRTCRGRRWLARVEKLQRLGLLHLSRAGSRHVFFRCFSALDLGLLAFLLPFSPNPRQVPIVAYQPRTA